MVCTDHGPGFIRYQVSPDKSPQAHNRGILRVYISPWNLEVAGDSHKTYQGPGGVKYIDIMLDSIAPLQSGRFAAGIQMGCLSDQIRRYFSDIGYRLRVVGLHMFRQLLKAIGKAINEIPIIQQVIDYHMNEAQGQSGICTRFYLQPQISPLSQTGTTRVDNHQFGSIFELLQG